MQFVPNNDRMIAGNHMMLHVLGVSHKRTAINVREEFARLAPGAGELVETGLCREAIVVSTCNRHETYIYSDRLADVEALFKTRLGLGVKVGAPDDAVHAISGEQAVAHLFGVAASIDSMVVGETQILGQIRSSEEKAVHDKTAGTYLRRLFVEARRTARLIRRSTSIGEGSVSMASIAVRLAEKIFGALSGKKVLLLGAGEMGRIFAESFAKANAVVWISAHRNMERLEELAKSTGANWIEADKVEKILETVDIVVAAAASEGFVLTRDKLEAVMNRRKDARLFVMDMGLPRNIDPEAANLPELYLYDVDDFDKIAAEHTKKRGKEIARAEMIIQEALQRWREIERDIAIRPVVAKAWERLKEMEHAATRDIASEELRRSIQLRLRRLFHFARKALSEGDELDRAFRLEGFKRLFEVDVP